LQNQRLFISHLYPFFAGAAFVVAGEERVKVEKTV
jgi:hypothetical protein